MGNVVSVNGKGIVFVIGKWFGSCHRKGTLFFSVVDKETLLCHWKKTTYVSM